MDISIFYEDVAWRTKQRGKNQISCFHGVSGVIIFTLLNNVVWQGFYADGPSEYQLAVKVWISPR